MKTMTAAEAKNNFGEMMEDSAREPVAVTKHGKPVRVMISAELYRYFRNEELKARVRKGELEAERGEIAEYDFESFLKEVGLNEEETREAEV